MWKSFKAQAKGGREGDATAKVSANFPRPPHPTSAVSPMMHLCILMFSTCPKFLSISVPFKARETAPGRVRVCSVSPRFVRTEFARGLVPGGDPAAAAAVFDSAPCLEAADVAEAVAFIAASPKRVEVQDIKIRCSSGEKRFYEKELLDSHFLFPLSCEIVIR